MENQITTDALRERPVQTPVSSLHLVHFSHKPIRKILNKKQDAKPDHKPNGLWVSCENSNLGWKEWCDENEYDGNWDYAYKVTLAQNAKILLLDDSRKINEFTKNYALDSWSIDWIAIAKLYDGIIIAPYQWSHRHNTNWYYTWDCASGCIWNAKAIKTILLFNADLKKCC